METEIGDNSQDGNESAGNVVRLPRDWLGPRGELIPFGPAARRAEEAAARAAAEAEVFELPRRPERSDVIDCTQDDFWGGDLESIPKPVIAPSADARDGRDVSSPTPARVASGQTRRARRGAISTYFSGLPRGHRAWPHRVRARAQLPMPAVAGSVAAAALAAVVGIALTGSGAPIAGHHAAVVHPALSRDASSIFPRALEPRPRRVVYARPRAVARPDHASKPHRAAPATTAPTTFVKTSTPSPVTAAATSTTSSTATPSTSTTPTRSASNSATTTATSVTAASTHKAKAGPVGPGAPFAPGQLG